jgi:hypothetical protein
MFRWKCQNCGALLKANWVTWILSAGILAFAIAIILAVILAEDLSVVPKDGGKPYIFLGFVLIVLPLACLGYFLGGYVLRE